jgi:hypothetical protein
MSAGLMQAESFSEQCFSFPSPVLSASKGTVLDLKQSS